MQISNSVVRSLQGFVDTRTVPGTSLREARLKRAGRVSRWGVTFLCLVALLFAAKGNSQVTGAGSIQGTITDATGALIPNASVTLTEDSTQVKLTTKSGSNGDYAFPEYQRRNVFANSVAPGFGTYTSTGNVLEIGSSIALNVKMTVGQRGYES